VVSNHSPRRGPSAFKTAPVPDRFTLHRRKTEVSNPSEVIPRPSAFEAALGPTEFVFHFEERGGLEPQRFITAAAASNGARAPRGSLSTSSARRESNPPDLVPQTSAWTARLRAERARRPCRLHADSTAAPIASRYGFQRSGTVLMSRSGVSGSLFGTCGWKCIFMPACCGVRASFLRLHG
jgi:hypothetical protein